MGIPFICDPKLNRGQLKIGINVFLFAGLLFRALSVGCALYLLIVINKDTALQTVHINFVDRLLVFGEIPLGKMLVTITYTYSFLVMPFQVINTLMGLLGVMCFKKSVNIIHVFMSMVSILVMVAFSTLVSAAISDFHYGISETFAREIYGNDAAEIQSKLTCCGFSGRNPCFLSVDKMGCWDAWSGPFYTLLSTLLAFFITMIVLEVLNIILTDYEYWQRSMKSEPERLEEIGIIRHLPRDIFGDICSSIVRHWRRGILPFLWRCVGIIQGMLGIALIAYGSYNMENYPSFVVKSTLARLRFNNIYFDDLIQMLSTFCIVSGSIFLLCSIQGVSVTCVSSRKAFYVSAFLNFGSFSWCVAVLIFWCIMYSRVCLDLEYELQDMFDSAVNYHPHESFATLLLQNVGCCGVREYGDIETLDRSGWMYEDRIRGACTNTRPCEPVLVEQFRTFTEVSLSLLVIGMVLEIALIIYMEIRIRTVPGETFNVLDTSPANHKNECPIDNTITDRVETKEKPQGENATGGGTKAGIKTIQNKCITSDPTSHQTNTARTSDQLKTISSNGKGLGSSIKNGIIELCKEDKLNGVSLVLKGLLMLLAVALIAVGFCLRFDEIFGEVDLHNLFYQLVFNQRRLTYYFSAISSALVGLGFSSIFLDLFAFWIYTWKSKCLGIFLIVLRAAFGITLIVAIGLCIETKSNIDWTMYGELFDDLIGLGFWYDYAHQWLPWKLLFFKMKCCGVNNYHDFVRVDYYYYINYNYNYHRYRQKFPVYCCINATEWRPELHYGEYDDCTVDLNPGLYYTNFLLRLCINLNTHFGITLKGCNGPLLDRFGGYMNAIFSLFAVLLFFQIIESILGIRRIRRSKQKNTIDEEIKNIFTPVLNRWKRNKVYDSEQTGVTNTSKPEEILTEKQPSESSSTKVDTALNGEFKQQPPTAVENINEPFINAKRSKKKTKNKKRQTEDSKQAAEVHKIKTPLGKASSSKSLLSSKLKTETEIPVSERTSSSQKESFEQKTQRTGKKPERGPSAKVTVHGKNESVSENRSDEGFYNAANAGIILDDENPEKTSSTTITTSLPETLDDGRNSPLEREAEHTPKNAVVNANDSAVTAETAEQENNRENITKDKNVKHDERENEQNQTYTGMSETKIISNNENALTDTKERNQETASEGVSNTTHVSDGNLSEVGYNQTDSGDINAEPTKLNVNNSASDIADISKTSAVVDTANTKDDHILDKETVEGENQTGPSVVYEDDFENEDDDADDDYANALNFFRAVADN